MYYKYLAPISYTVLKDRNGHKIKLFATRRHVAKRGDEVYAIYFVASVALRVCVYHRRPSAAILACGDCSNLRNTWIVR